MIEFAAKTHPGNRYQHNEDSIGWNEGAGLWFVADGMGGHARGDIASATVKRALLGAARDPDRSLYELVLLAHEAVLLEGIEQSLPNMGSTVVMTRVQGSVANVAWCGDSRAYLWRDGELTRLTRDHSLLEQLLESGVVAPEDAFDHPRRNVLVQALGINDPPPDPSEVQLTLANDDMLLMCSDGIHDELRDSVLSDVLTHCLEPQAVVDELERRVLALEARDNLSVVCLKATGLSQLPGSALDVKEVPNNRITVPRATPVTQPRIVDTLELPVAGTLSSSRSTDSLDSDSVVTPKSVPQTVSIPALPTAPASAHATPEKTSANSPTGVELWLALFCVALLVVLVVVFT